MKSPRPRPTLTHAALTALALFTLALAAHAQDPKPAQPPPAVGVGGGGPGPVAKAERDAAGPFRTNQVETRALITYRPEPGFTDEALENDSYGVVRLRAVFSWSGEVTDIRVVKGLPDGLTEKAIAAVKQIHFTP